MNLFTDETEHKFGDKFYMYKEIKNCKSIITCVKIYYKGIYISKTEDKKHLVNLKEVESGEVINMYLTNLKTFKTFKIKFHL